MRIVLLMSVVCLSGCGVLSLGQKDEFVEHGNIPALRELHGITAAAALEKILNALGEPLPLIADAEKGSAATVG